jgi:outer membrane protein assembly factor BamB
MRYLLIALLSIPLAASAADPWSTHRGNARRTGNVDNVPGPEKPVVLWALPSTEHFIAAPVPSGESVIFSSLGAFNRPSMVALPAKADKVVEPRWTRSSPYLKLPTVSAPAEANGHLFFGDGMHQTDGAILHCVPAKGGLPIWRLAVPGELVHLEGAPTVANNRVYIGGGAAGVLCVEADKARLDGKDYDLATIAQMQEMKWKTLQAEYEVDKKKDPDFAIPPSEDQLHKPTPRLVWQQGKGKWHVDAPVLLAGEKLLVSSAFLDKEKVGDRAVHCLNAATGEPLWRAPLTTNPWGGATLGDGIVIVAGSSASYDPKSIATARGEVVALDIEKGTERWKTPIPGGVLGCAAIADDLAIFTATDGKVRALGLADGKLKWEFDAKTPFFAPPAVVASVVYVVDLKGVVHALDAKKGEAKWTLDLGADPAVKAPGMVYGGISVQDGNLFLATCNLEGANAQKPTAAVCISQK